MDKSKIILTDNEIVKVVNNHGENFRSYVPRGKLIAEAQTEKLLKIFAAFGFELMQDKYGRYIIKERWGTTEWVINAELEKELGLDGWRENAKDNH